MSSILFAVEESNHIFLPGDINEFYWGSAAFLIVVAFIWWKIVPIVRKQIKASKEKIKEDVNYAERAAETAKAELADMRAGLGDTDRERERILAEARASAENLEVELKTRADQEAADLRSRSEQDVELARIQAESDIARAVSDQAFEAVQGVVSESLTSELQSRLVDSYIDSDLKTAQK